MLESELEPQPELEPERSCAERGGRAWPGWCAVGCRVCRRQEREGLFERLITKVTKRDARYDTPEAICSRHRTV